jgi:hypothetical protein
MKTHAFALFASTVAAAALGYALACQHTEGEIAKVQARYDRLRRHIIDIRFLMTKITPDEPGMELARKAAFRLALDPDELP